MAIVPDLIMELDITEFLRKLVAFESMSPNGGGICDFLNSVLREIGFSSYIIEKDGVKSLWAEYGDSTEYFCFAGHADVVPPGNLGDWLSNPFRLTNRDGVLYGRGAADMKGGISAFVSAIVKFLSKHKTIPMSIGILIAGDEEIAGSHGTEDVLRFLEAQNKRIKYCVLAESTSEERVGDTVKTGRRGSLSGRVTIHGVQGHAAYPEKALNPIHESLDVLTVLRDFELDSGYDGFPPSAIQITNVESGSGAVNVIPGSLSALFNIRLNPHHSHESLKQKIENVLQESGARFSLEWFGGSEPFIAKDGFLRQKIYQVIKNTCGFEPEFSFAGGSSDGGFFVSRGIELIELGLKNESAHKANESVSVDDLNILSDIFLNLLKAIMCKESS